MEHKAIVTGIRRSSTRLREVNSSLSADVAATAERLEAAAARASYWISADGRMGEADVAELLGLTPGTLANKRREGTAPLAYVLGGRGHRVSYRLIDIARWIEAHRDS